MHRNVYTSSDSAYGSRSSMGSSWNTLDSWQSISRVEVADIPGRYDSVDLLDLKRNKLADMMEEFKRNGHEAPYNPEEDKMSNRSGNLIGMGPSTVYLRQKSWPAPESTPAHRLPRPKSDCIPSAAAPSFVPPKKFYSGDNEMMAPMKQIDTISAEQVRVLQSLPNAVIYALLRQIEQARNESSAKNKHMGECRFCKNNGECESYFRSHTLKDLKGRVTCPVLRKYVCKRCGARGDHAHTLKYCPFSTDEERIKSSAMMRSVRKASGGRRPHSLASEFVDDYVSFGEVPPSVLQDFNHCAPLDPRLTILQQRQKYDQHFCYKTRPYFCR